MLSGHQIPSPMCLAVGWKIHFHLRTRMLLSDDGEQFEATYITWYRLQTSASGGVKFLLRTLSARQNLVPQFFGVSKYELL